MHLCNHVMFGDGKNRIALQNLIYFYALLFTIQYMYLLIPVSLLNLIFFSNIIAKFSF